MRQTWYLLKTYGGIPLVLYAILFWIYSFASLAYFMIFIFDESVKFSGSSWEQSIRWFALHPAALLIFVVLTIPGIIIIIINRKELKAFLG